MVICTQLTARHSKYLLRPYVLKAQQAAEERIQTIYKAILNLIAKV